MNLAFCGYQPESTARLAFIADGGGFDAYPFDRPQDFCSFLYRTGDVAGIYVSDDDITACEHLIEWRLAGVDCPLMVLLENAGTDISGLARLLMAGADDALRLPLSDEDLRARMVAIGRRQRPVSRPRVRLPNGAVFDRDRGLIHFEGGGTVILSRTEAAIFDFLASRHGKPANKADIMLHLYPDEPERPKSKLVDVFICRIRKKIVPALGGLDVIENTYGSGYHFNPEGFEPTMIRARAAR